MRAFSFTSRRALAAAVAALAISGSGLAACAYNETLGRDQLLLVDDAALAQAAEQAWRETLATKKVSRDPVLNERVTRVGRRIADASGLQGQRWEYVVFDDPSANAFVLPGGKIGVNTGLFRSVQNDDQLAAVIGHEVGHVMARHAAERYSQAIAAQVGLSAAGQAIDSQAAMQAMGIGAQLGAMSYSRKHELEADRLGVDLMARAGYRPAEALTLWRNMASNRTGGQPPQILSTHPSDSTRIAELEAYMRSKGMI